MTHTHNCMRCGDSFFCFVPTNCKAGLNVMPRIVVPGPNGKPQVFEHVCAPEKRSPMNEKHLATQQEKS